MGHAERRERLVRVVEMVHSRAQLVGEGREVLKEPGDAHGVVHTKIVAVLHAHELADGAGPLLRRYDDGADRAVVPKSGPEYRRAALALGCNRHAETDHDRDVPPAADQTHESIESHRHKLWVVGEDVAAEDVGKVLDAVCVRMSFVAL